MTLETFKEKFLDFYRKNQHLAKKEIVAVDFYGDIANEVTLYHNSDEDIVIIRTDPPLKTERL